MTIELTDADLIKYVDDIYNITYEFKNLTSANRSLKLENEEIKTQVNSLTSNILNGADRLDDYSNTLLSTINHFNLKEELSNIKRELKEAITINEEMKKTNALLQLSHSNEIDSLKDSCYSEKTKRFELQNKIDSLMKQISNTSNELVTSKSIISNQKDKIFTLENRLLQLSTVQTPKQVTKPPPQTGSNKKKSPNMKIKPTSKSNKLSVTTITTSAPTVKEKGEVKKRKLYNPFEDQNLID